MWTLWRSDVRPGQAAEEGVGSGADAAGDAAVRQWIVVIRPGCIHRRGTTCPRTIDGCPLQSTGLSTTVYWTNTGETVLRSRSPRRGQAPPVRAFCLIRLVSSVTWLNVERFSAICSRILRLACITVVWSRPPKSCPILGRDSSVSSRHRYMAICRALTRTRDRSALHRASIETEK